ncbi:RHE_PE00001 family protein [Bradyrhizobium elkanii]|uniref:RHE_PE00001 family protein n=1 Tax=Bradyrhizobium elkanii TaxID=29448 RepID=UPI003515D09F
MPYTIADPIPWTMIAGPLVAAEDAVARLDERLAKSPIRGGWIARTHFADACASLWLEGELVHLEDLVLHDAEMDIRAPTHELTRARAVLRTRRWIADAEPGWALSGAGLDRLRGRGGEGGWQRTQSEAEPDDEHAAGETASIVEDDDLAALFADVDAAIANSDRVLAGEVRMEATRPAERDPLIYDGDWNEDSRLAEWRSVVDRTRDLPSTLAAAIAAEAWTAIEPLQHSPWIGRLLAAAVLQDRGKTRRHLSCLHAGMKAIPLERRRPRDRGLRLAVELEAIAAAAEAGLKDHDRWAIARELLTRKIGERRSTSKLPALLDYVMTRPIVSAGMVAKELKVSQRAAQDLVGELGLREATGRGRYRAWGIL